MTTEPPPLPESDAERTEIRKLLQELGDDEAASTNRIAVCAVIAAALASMGRILWVGGTIIGPDRVTKASPFGFGDNRTVGIATVAQIGGQLALGAINLLRAGNDYAASALLRQLVEVEYLAHAFAAEHDTAAAWLRADRQARRSFWSPQKMRNRAGGEFIDEHYWSHCELGGHPTTEGMPLLPDHSRTITSAFLWVDLAGHLARIWTHVVVAAERVWGESISMGDLKLPDVDAAVHAWRSTDGLYAALQDLGAQQHPERPSN